MSHPRPDVGRELDLSLAVEHEHPEIKLERLYLVKHGGNWIVGTFSRVWYGLIFSWFWGANNLQFDAPGWNSSRWERVFEMQGVD